MRPPRGELAIADLQAKQGRGELEDVAAAGAQAIHCRHSDRALRTLHGVGVTPPRLVRYAGLRAASAHASAAARGASRKRDTKPELALRKALWALGLRYRVDVADLPGRPDVVFTAARTVVFCDGDFWHGHNLSQRLASLRRGHNAPYWVAKIASNVERDRRHDDALRVAGWRVLRFWESEIKADLERVVREVARAVATRRSLDE